MSFDGSDLRASIVELFDEGARRDTHIPFAFGELTIRGAPTRETAEERRAQAHVETVEARSRRIVARKANDARFFAALGPRAPLTTTPKALDRKLPCCPKCRSAAPRHRCAVIESDASYPPLTPIERPYEYVLCPRCGSRGANHRCPG